MWQSMSKKDQQKYYDMAAAEREEHQQSNDSQRSAMQDYLHHVLALRISQLDRT